MFDLYSPVDVAVVWVFVVVEDVVEGVLVVDVVELDVVIVVEVVDCVVVDIVVERGSTEKVFIAIILEIPWKYFILPSAYLANFPNSFYLYHNSKTPSNICHPLHFPK